MATLIRQNYRIGIPIQVGGKLHLTMPDQAVTSLCAQHSVASGRGIEQSVNVASCQWLVNQGVAQVDAGFYCRRDASDEEATAFIQFRSGSTVLREFNQRSVLCVIKMGRSQSKWDVASQHRHVNLIIEFYDDGEGKIRADDAYINIRFMPTPTPTPVPTETYTPAPTATHTRTPRVCLRSSTPKGIQVPQHSLPTPTPTWTHTPGTADTNLDQHTNSAKYRDLDEHAGAHPNVNLD